MIIKTEETSKNLSTLGGLKLYSKVIDKLDFFKVIETSLPKDKRNSVESSIQKARALILASVAGADCLDDLDKLSVDPGFKAANKHVHDATQYGAFLRKFNDVDIKSLQYSLIDVALKLRFALQPKNKNFTLDLDSTVHTQHAKKMEGLGFGYNREWGLSSLQAYDELGINYWFDVRGGSVNTIIGANEVISNVFSRLPKGMNKIFRADSGYCATHIFNSCYVQHAKFVIAAREDFYIKALEKITTWKRTNLQFQGERKCEIAHALYQHKNGIEPLRVVILRAERDDGAMHESYDYYAWITNIGQHEMSDEKIIQFYRKRGASENFIRESKYGFDAKHFPCQKLSANKTYGLLYSVGYNLMRFMSHVDNPRKPQFAKAIRFRTVNLACEVAKHAGYATFRFMKHIHTEVLRYLEIIHIKFQSGLDLTPRYGPRFLTS